MYNAATRKYRRMTYTDRLIIEKLYNAGCTYREIAEKTGFAISSVHYEVRKGKYLHRNHDLREIPRYSADISQQDSEWQASAKGAEIKLSHNYEYAAHVQAAIRKGYSPDQITGSLRRAGKWTVSTPTLYRYIASGYIPGVSLADLPVARKQKKRRSYRHVTASRPPAGVSIERRNFHPSDRSCFGHWEMDTVIGHKSGPDQVLLVLTERKTRFEIISKLHDKTAKSVCTALQNVVQSFQNKTFLSVTCDNGVEFSDYTTLQTIVPNLYYCHPYSSWERGSNENANRFIRRFYPKGTSLQKVTQADCEVMAHFINTRPRKVLGYSTAEEEFHRHLSAL